MTSSARPALAAALLAASTAAADPYDLRLFKLGNPDTTSDAQAKFRAFARQFGAALTSVSLTPPETLGHSAFALNAELSVVQLRQDELACTLGALNCIPTERFNPDPLDRRPGIDGSLLIPSIHLRKGLPFSLEVGARMAWIEKSRMAAATGEVKWAINEGFTYLPDVSLRGSLTKLLSPKDFDLTAAGADLALGKEFAIGGMITLTPYIGWNLVWVGASSNTIDFTPSRSYEEGVCGPNPASCDPNAQIAIGSGVYEEVSLGDNSHNRFYAGARFIGGVVQLGVEYSMSQLPRLPRVDAFNFTLGLDF
jgi:hypothetical protein